MSRGPFMDPTKPVALPGEYVRLEPSGVTKRVLRVEQMARIGPVDYGSASSDGGTATEGGSATIDLHDELEMSDNTLGQFIVNPLSQVDVKIKQTGQQDQRFVNKNQVGSITMDDPPNQRVIWTYSDQDLYIEITNNRDWDMAKTLVYYTGFKLVLEEGESNNVDHAAAVPVDTLKKSPSEALP